MENLNSKKKSKSEKDSDQFKRRKCQQDTCEF